MKNLTQILALPFVLLVAAPEAAAQNAMSTGQGGHGDMHASKKGMQVGGLRGGHAMKMRSMFSMSHVLLRHADELKLSDEQVGKLHRLMTAHAQSRREMMMGMHREMGALHGMILDPATNDSAFKEGVKKHTDSFSQIANDAWKERTAALAVLSAQQRAALQKMQLTQDGQDEGAE